MTRTRELIEEILEIRQRRRSVHRTSELFFRMIALERAFERRSEIEPELLKYFPVALVACLEGFFRLAMSEIIDTGPPFLEAAVKLLTNIKFDYEFIKALHGKRITTGDFISHQVPLSSLTHIQTHLSALLNKEFLRELRNVTNRVAHEIHGKPKTPILADPDAIYGIVERTFELRHIICHELATNFKVSCDDVERCFFSTMLFLKASGELISETLHPGAPLTQTDMNIAAGEELHHLLEKIRTIEQEIISLLEKDRAEEFTLAASSWHAYMESWANFEANECKGGTIWPTMYANCAAELAKQRVGQLSEYLENYKQRWV